MKENTAIITFHSPDFLTLNPSYASEVEILEMESGYALRVPVVMESSGESSIQEVLQACGINLTRPAVPLVNGKPQDMSYILAPGDEIIMLFQISGG